MKEEILEIVQQELNMTNRPEYTQALNDIVVYSKNLDDNFEDNMKLYKKAKAVFSDTSPREQLFLAKEAYVRKMSDSE